MSPNVTGLNWAIFLIQTIFYSFFVGRKYQYLWLTREKEKGVKLNKSGSAMTMVACVIALLPFGTRSDEPSWIPIETNSSVYRSMDVSAESILETRTFHTASCGGKTIEARTKTCGISNWIFLNTEKFYGFFLILK